jgi:hypothetical protein
LKISVSASIDLVALLGIVVYQSDATQRDSHTDAISANKHWHWEINRDTSGKAWILKEKSEFMADDFLQNLGELGASIRRYIDAEIKRQRREEREIAASSEFDDEPYDLSPSQLSAYMQKKIGRDKIIEFVHSGVLRGCFIKLGTHSSSSDWLLSEPLSFIHNTKFMVMSL